MVSVRLLLAKVALQSILQAVMTRYVDGLIDAEDYYLRNIRRMKIRDMDILCEKVVKDSLSRAYVRTEDYEKIDKEARRILDMLEHYCA